MPVTLEGNVTLSALLTEYYDTSWPKDPARKTQLAEGIVLIRGVVEQLLNCSFGTLYGYQLWVKNGHKTATLVIENDNSSLASIIVKLDRLLAGPLTADDKYQRTERLMLRAAELGYTELSDELLTVAQELQGIAERADLWR